MRRTTITRLVSTLFATALVTVSLSIPTASAQIKDQPWGSCQADPSACLPVF